MKRYYNAIGMVVSFAGVSAMILGGVLAASGFMGKSIATTTLGAILMFAGAVMYGGRY